MLKTVGLSLAFLIGSITNALFLTNSCDLEPRFFNKFTGETENLTSLNAPHGCQRGLFYWGYPRGHVVLHFPNGWRLPLKICFRDDIGGDVFTISDVTPGVNYTLDHVESGSNKTVCTDPSTATDIVLKIDAPETQRYMGSLAYIVKV